MPEQVMYIDGYTYAVPIASKETFVKFAQTSAELFKKIVFSLFSG